MKILLTILSFFLFCTISAQIPYNLNSRPSARPTIFLDFDGQTVNSEFWVPFNNQSQIFCLPTTLTTAQIIKIFNHISEDFSPFNVNITTDSTVYFSAPITRRTRAIFTPTSSWYSSAGGTAYIESFRWGLETPCFIFTDRMKNEDKLIAEVGSHEIGHTLGLYHQSQYRNIGTDSCRFVDEYHPGRGTGDIGWAPIMGNSYFRNLTSWSIGLTLNCNSPQNDFNIITNSINGITYVPDDHGNTISTGTNVNLTNNNFSVNGLINDSNDLDHYRFQLNVPGRLTINIRPFNSGKEILTSFPTTGIFNYNSNIDIETTLFNGELEIGKYNPSGRLDVSIDTLLNPGVYTFRINSMGNTNTPKGLMLGTYKIEGSFGGSVVVPIRYIDFYGYLVNGKNQLHWNIVSDEEIKNVIIQYSENISSWKDLTILNPKIQNYTFNEKDKLTYYYRIKIITINNEIYYSNTIQIKNNQQKYFVNNNNNQITINSEIKGSWKLLDMSGRSFDGGIFNIGVNHIDISRLNSGVYLLQLLEVDKINIIKIVK